MRSRSIAGQRPLCGVGEARRGWVEEGKAGCGDVESFVGEDQKKAGLATLELSNAPKHGPHSREHHSSQREPSLQVADWPVGAVPLCGGRGAGPLLRRWHSASTKWLRREHNWASTRDSRRCCRTVHGADLNIHSGTIPVCTACVACAVPRRAAPKESFT